VRGSARRKRLNKKIKILNVDDLVKSLKLPICVWRKPESSCFKDLQIPRTPVFTKVTTFYETIKFYRNLSRGRRIYGKESVSGI
jgi:hypothetical protein